MTKKTKKQIEIDKLKYEIAEELGLTSKVSEGGWAELTAAETGRIGGIISNRFIDSKKT